MPEDDSAIKLQVANTRPEDAGGFARLAETLPSVTVETEKEYEEMVRTLRQESPQRRQIGFLPLRQSTN
jgi:transitional endoplasmic reticulum ATPase